MDTRLQQIIEAMTTDLAAWIESEDETTKKIAAMKAQMQELGGTLKGDALKAAMRGLEDAEREARRAKQREAADAIASLCHPLGVRLTAQEPPKRRRATPKGGARKAASGADTATAEPTAPDSDG